MRLSPLDIRKQEFTRSFRGYDPEEVQAFLQMVSSQWEDLLDEQRHLAERLRDMETKLQHYEKVEEALQEALQTARETSRKALANAEEKARLIIKDAEAQAQSIRQDAERERHQLKRETAGLTDRRNEIVTRLRAFLMSEMELLARFDGDDPVGFIKLLPAEERTREQRTGSALPSPEPRRDTHAPVSYEDEPETYEDDEPVAPAARTAAPSSVRREEDRRAPRVTWHPGPPGETGKDDDFEVEDEPAAQPSPAFEESEAQAMDDEEERRETREEVRQGQGWTARTVVSIPTGQRASDRQQESEDARRVSASDEEIDKIRRILNDLD